MPVTAPGAAMSGAEQTINLRAVTEFLRQFVPFDQMAAEDLSFLAAHCQLAFYGAGEEILSPASGKAGRLYIVKQGQVRGERPGGGEERDRVFLIGPGECFPLRALLDDRPTRTIHRAVRDTFCFELPRAAVDTLLARSEQMRDLFFRGHSGLLERAARQIQAEAAEALSARDILNAPLSRFLGRGLVVCAPSTSIREAAITMRNEQADSIAVCDEDLRPLGIFTQRDLVNVVAKNIVSLEQPIGLVMTPDPRSLPPQAFAFEAAFLMASHHFRHVCVIEGGRLAGIVSEHDLFALQQVSLVNLTSAIAHAADIAALQATRPQIHRLIDAMLAQGVLAEQLIHIISLLNDHTVRRTIELCQAELSSPVPSFTWLAFGSEGRREQTLHTDQDNGMLFAIPPGSDASAMREQLLPLARRVNQALAAIGFPLCQGNVMAGNPELCLSEEEWRVRFNGMVDFSTSENLLRSGIYFDLRPILGPAEPAHTLFAEVARLASNDTIFLRMLAENALRIRPPLGLIHDFVVDHAAADTIDLKLHGIRPIVDAARVLALANGIAVSGTAERLRALAERGVMATADVESWLQSFFLIELFRMRNHQAQHAQGQPLSNRINPTTLTAMDQRSLKEAFREARRLQRRLELDYRL